MEWSKAKHRYASSHAVSPLRFFRANRSVYPRPVGVTAREARRKNKNTCPDVHHLHHHLSNNDINASTPVSVNPGAGTKIAAECQNSKMPLSASLESTRAEGFPHALSPAAQNSDLLAFDFVSAFVSPIAETETNQSR